MTKAKGRAEGGDGAERGRSGEAGAAHGAPLPARARLRRLPRHGAAGGSELAGDSAGAPGREAPGAQVGGPARTGPWAAAWLCAALPQRTAGGPRARVAAGAGRGRRPSGDSRVAG